MCTTRSRGLGAATERLFLVPQWCRSRDGMAGLLFGALGSRLWRHGVYGRARCLLARCGGVASVVAAGGRLLRVFFSAGPPVLVLAIRALPNASGLAAEGGPTALRAEIHARRVERGVPCARLAGRCCTLVPLHHLRHARGDATWARGATLSAPLVAALCLLVSHGTPRMPRRAVGRCPAPWRIWVPISDRRGEAEVQRLWQRPSPGFEVP
mmetsp:Transcript_34444/g.94798  ORF Transcript_34444/g.94798 Transcript_34444/m.94798 type:complete len:211 (-) Transcript_34444:797-1429(-)